MTDVSTVLGDAYSQKARLAPALFVALPLVLGVLPWIPDGIDGVGILMATVAWFGGATMASELGRQRGKRLQTRLFASWGGKPTSRFLRHRHASNKLLLERRHRQLTGLFPDLKLPSAEAEHRDRLAADEVYDACVTRLVQRTRDRTKFPVVFAENQSYGFRRNLLGLKAFGVGSSLVGLAAGIARVWIALHQQREIEPMAVMATVGCAVVLLILATVVRDEWVLSAAEAYATQLLDACDALECDRA